MSTETALQSQIVRSMRFRIHYLDICGFSSYACQQVSPRCLQESMEPGHRGSSGGLGEGRGVEGKGGGGRGGIIECEGMVARCMLVTSLL